MPVPYSKLEKSIDAHLYESPANNIAASKPVALETGIGTMIVGDSTSMQETVKFIRRIAATDSAVLITGETGAGKELAASMIHHKSSRAKKEIVCINCAALPENLVESELYGHARGAFTGAVAAVKGKFEHTDEAYTWHGHNW